MALLCFVSDYVQELLREVEKCREAYPSYRKAEVLVKEEPLPLTHTLGIIPKEELLARYQSRLGHRSSPSTSEVPDVDRVSSA